MVTAAALAAGGPGRTTGALVALCAFALATALMRPVEMHVSQLPLMRHVPHVAAAVAAAVALRFAVAPAFSLFELAMLPLMAVAGELLIDRPLSRRFNRARRIALVGPDHTARAVADELRLAGAGDSYELVGRIAVGPADVQGHTRVLGNVDEMAQVVTEYAIDLLVLSPEIPRLPVFEAVSASCLGLPVRLLDLNNFCERVFGHVPVRSINGAWFQYLMHPRFRHGESWVKRAIDVAIASAVALPLLPLLAILAPLIRRDGGSVFFVQERIGEGGRPFSIYKLRTMAPSDGPTTWTVDGDMRVTRIGRLLRRTHLDELPQVFNVLRGEMSIVGPRPEQPSYVEELEDAIPYYSRRHLIKPGITGWAQVRCGYAGSVEGSAWKLCHDLYYVKHRSLALDLVILGETIRTFFADRQFGAVRATEGLPAPVAAQSHAREGLLVSP